MEHHMELHRSAKGFRDPVSLKKKNKLAGGSGWEIILRDGERKKNSGVSCLLCDVQLKVQVLWEKTEVGRKQQKPMAPG